VRTDLRYISILIVVSLVLLGVGLIFSITIYLKSQREQLTSEMHRDTSTSAAVCSSIIKSQFEEFLDDVQFLARGSTSALQPDGTLSTESKEIYRNLLENKKPAAESVTRVNARMEIVYTFPDERLAGTDLSYQAHIKRLYAIRRPVISGLFRSVQGYDCVALHVPVFIDGRFDGSVALLLNLDVVCKERLLKQMHEPLSCLILVDRTGQVVFSATTGNTPEDPAVVSAIAGKAIHIGEGAQAITVGMGEKERSLFVSFEPVRALDDDMWTVAVGTDVGKEAELSTVDVRLIGVAWLTYIFIVFLLIAGLFLHGRKLLALKDETLLRVRDEYEKTQENYKLIFDNATVGIFHTDPEGRIVSCNRTLCELSGSTQEKLVGMSLLKHPDQRIADIIARALKGETAGFTGDFRTTFSGKGSSIAATAVGIRGANGSVTGVIGIVENLNEISAMRLRLEESTGNLRSLLTSLHVGVLILEDGVFVDCNQAATEVYGVADRSDVIGKTPLDFSPLRQPDGSSSREGATERIQNALATGYCVFEWTHRHADGTDMPCEVRLTRMLSSDKPRLLALVYDISERRKYEEAQAMLMGAVSRSADAVCVVDSEMQIIYSNPSYARLMELGEWNSVGMNALELQRKRCGTDRLDEMRAAIEARQPWRGNARCGADEHGQPSHEVSVFPFLVEQGKATRFMITYRDVTKEMRLASAVVDRRKFDMAARMARQTAHELNNHIFVLQGLIERLKWGSNAPDGAFSEFDKAFERIGRLVRDLHSLGKELPTAGKPVAYGGFLARSKQSLQSLLAVDSELLFECDPDAGEIFADPDQIEQVLNKLVANSAEAKPAGNVITIGCKKLSRADVCALPVHPLDWESAVEIFVSDTAGGIPASVMEQLFEPYVTTKPEPDGPRGMGLAIVKNLVQKNGGVVFAENKPGKGVTFRMVFPSHKSALPADTPA